MEKKILEGEEAVFNVLQDINDLMSTKEDTIDREDLTFSLLLYAINYAYDANEEAPEIAHMILNISGAAQAAKHKGKSLNEMFSNNQIKH
tara:strand:+ start:146 stop:415 length:270 start_codon:yes stop_codon:yes gene_type:complete